MSTVDNDSMNSRLTEDDCATLFKTYTNKDNLPNFCKTLLDRKNSGVYGVAENHNLNVKGGHRYKNGQSHASLQRRFTGPMSGYGVAH
ncbi:hypothetical protein B5M09_007878 [Aphanomyces astaci]|uniref:Uncharacterized protein n=1 Tax=Aphanomyces astaci TaxID=112090 RepID=A0A3R7Y4L4_APHAT|nr:hypothetical protein B5M09_007878 [Aphanomyces astaci]